MVKVLESSAKKNRVLVFALVALMSGGVFADTDDIINSNISRQQQSTASQGRIDQLADETDDIISEFHQQRKQVETLKLFNDRLRRSIEAQERAKTSLITSIEDASLIERQIVPLMMRMIDGLEKFIAADIPFKLDERNARVERIRGYLTNANISAAERFRQVFSAYDSENSYGLSAAVYNDTLTLPSGDLTVNVLQVGRAGLYYQTLDGDVSGYWDKASGAWQELDSSYNQGISDAIRIVEGKETVDLMSLPIIAPEVL